MFTHKGVIKLLAVQKGRCLLSNNNPHFFFSTYFGLGTILRHFLTPARDLVAYYVISEMRKLRQKWIKSVPNVQKVESQDWNLDHLIPELAPLPIMPSMIEHV